MRITRAAKVAAFPLLALVLVVALIACEGPPGVDGTDGTDGGPGVAGVDGTSGLDGLQVAPVLINADVTAAGTDTEINLNDYFSGGTEPYTFTIEGTPANFAKAEIDGSNLIVLLDATGAADYATGSTVDVVAVDANSAVEESTVTVIANRAPTAVAGAVSALTIGTQAATATLSDVGYSCAAFNECVLDLFTDDGDLMDSVTAPDGSDNFGWTVNVDGRVVVTGLVPTRDTDTGADAPITLTIEAEDTNGLSATLDIALTVNKAPEESDGAADVSRAVSVDGITSTAQITSSPASLFTDLEGDRFTVAFSTSNPAVATVDPTTGEVTGIARGSATVTATATEDASATGIGQSGTIDFSVTVE